MANINITSDAWTEISITSGTVQNISATADIELSAEQTDNSGVVLKPSELYQWDNETIYARAVTEETGALRVVNFKRAAGGGASVAYSTTEQVIGTWIDNKPIYQITIDAGNLPNNSSTDFNVDTNIETMIRMFGFAFANDNSGYTFNIPRVRHDDITMQADIVYSGYAAHSIKIFTGADLSTMHGYITIQYTKKTD